MSENNFDDRQMRATTDSYARAGRHNITFRGPAADFFEGALLGNGGLGVVVTTRPDALLLHFGHNNVWDIRIAERHADEILTFREVYERFAALPPDLPQLTDNPWYREYCRMAGDNYSKPYPRPMPCGSLLLRYDRRRAEVLGHTVHIGDGRCTVDFLADGQPARFEAFVEAGDDRLWMSVTDPGTGTGIPLFQEVRLLPDPETPAEFPAPVVEADPAAGLLSFMQILPYEERPASPYPGHAKDKAFRLAIRLADAAAAGPADENGLALRLRLRPDPARGFLACAELREGRRSDIEGRDKKTGEEGGSKGLAALLDRDPSLPPAPSGGSASAAVRPPRPDLSRYRAALARTQEQWRVYWKCSFVALEDDVLERVWYRNLYFLNCSVREGVTCPGLFANWSYRKIGADWHGDYHMNYNTQQPFWVAFTSNHLDKHLPYVNMVDQVLPVSRKWAREYYGLRGAYFPHSAYPVEMSMMPYPVPHWGWEVCETPWTVQSLWWHYLYSMDESFLRDRAFVPIKEAVLFMVDYMKRPEARGDRWNDDRYHIFPTVVPELYEITPGFAKNSDALIDLTLTRFIFRAFAEACNVLGRTDYETDLLNEIEEISGHFPEYPVAESPRGPVFVSVSGEDPEVVYNVPVPLAAVFPGEEHGLHSAPDDYRIAVNTYLNHRNEGGNELVFYHLAGARLGVLDLERFKRQIAYCELPNGTCTDRVLMSGGRYRDTTDFDFMSRMGIWFENFALPAVINECLLQSYNGTLRLFPNWPDERRAEFGGLRAAGGFLVSAAFAGGEVQWVEIVCEAGAPLKLHVPWRDGAYCTRSGRPGEEPPRITGELLELETSKGETIRLMKNA
ncbi:glycosyl hydrolase family 95 catalytic domain-containing protein [Paenibacillus macerans]|uniref:glycosyl hydrolase family 95 catalytic domain-containing protein n=1 Tax=Paenibacillus macerans TaxID=44252 RepID=UPI003D3220C8